MPHDLERRYGMGHYHFVAFSCYRRQAFLSTVSARELFEDALERMRCRYGYTVDAYVVMPEHAHLLMSEPVDVTLSVALQAVKLSVVRRRPERPFWQKRFYSFNVFTDEKRVEKRRYIHRNPWVRGLVTHPKDWVGSSYRQWAYGETGCVEVETTWTYARRKQAELAGRVGLPQEKPTSQKRDVGHPSFELEE